jgi:putative redox protein
MRFIAQTGSGHEVPMDVAPEIGGQNSAARPMEMLLVGAGGCSSIDVVMILQKGRHTVTGCEVVLEAERAATEPKVFETLHMHYIVTGTQLPHAAVARAVALSHEKYCSATIMLAKTATLTHSIEVREA